MSPHNQDPSTGRVHVSLQHDVRHHWVEAHWQTRLRHKLTLEEDWLAHLRWLAMQWLVAAPPPHHTRHTLPRGHAEVYAQQQKNSEEQK